MGNNKIYRKYYILKPDIKHLNPTFPNLSYLTLGLDNRSLSAIMHLSSARAVFSSRPLLPLN